MIRSDAKVDVWVGSGNISEYVIYVDDTAVTDLSGVTRAVICLNGVDADSDDDATLVWWTDSVTSKTLPDGTSYTGDVLRARLGKTTGLTAGCVFGSISLYGTIAGLTFDATAGALTVSDSVLFDVQEICQ
jgi:hypothetical protein